jgi:hypothetical protein
MKHLSTIREPDPATRLLADVTQRLEEVTQDKELHRIAFVRANKNIGALTLARDGYMDALNACEVARAQAANAARDWKLDSRKRMKWFVLALVLAVAEALAIGWMWVPR